MEEKIMQLLDALYELSAEDKAEFESEISKMDEPTKEAFALALYKRYEDFKTNLSDLDRWLKFISNDIASYKEQKEADKIEFNF